MTKKAKTVKKTAKTKRATPQLFCVTTYSTFRLQYLVQASSEDAALQYIHDAVATTDIVEWQQYHLGEVVAHAQPMTWRDAQRAHAASEETGGSPWVPLNPTFINDASGRTAVAVLQGKANVDKLG